MARPTFALFANLMLTGAKHSLIVALVFILLMTKFEQLLTGLAYFGVYKLLIPFTYVFLLGLSFHC